MSLSDPDGRLLASATSPLPMSERVPA